MWVSFRLLAKSLLAVAVVGLGFVSARTVRAQDTVTGAFEGTISDSQSGAALKGALVEIINQQTNVAISLRTDYRGRFYQGLLLPGIYRIRVSATGYQTREAIQPLKITYTGEVVPVPVALDPGPAVPPPAAAGTAAATLADTEIRASIITVDARRSGSFGDEEVTSLPLGGTTLVRTFDELALLLPGVAPPPQTLGSVAGPGVGPGVGSAGQFSVNGMRSRGNNFTVDGSDNNDEDIGVRRQGFVALIPQPIESVQEYQVITLLAPAQFGRNIGGQVNAVSKSGGNKMHGTIYGTFNSSQLNARNFFDTRFGNATSVVQANNQAVLLQTRNSSGAVLTQQPLTVQNQSGGEDSLTFVNGGFVLGGPIRTKSFYFFSFEKEVINARREESFAVPTVEQRGAFGTGATGIFQDPFTGQPTATIPTSINGAATLSLYPFPNNPDGVFGRNTLTQSLPASARGTVFSAKIEHNFSVKGREQSLTGRYNFTQDWREIPATGGAIFSTLKPEVRTQNFSFFWNSKLSNAGSTKSIFNQVRLSYGRTRLRFVEVRDQGFLIPSGRFPTAPFFLNAPELVNTTLPASAGTANTGPVIYVRNPTTVEREIGPLGQVIINGFSPLGVNAFNFPQRRVNNTYQLADQLTLRAGDHRITLGTDNRRTELNSELPRNSRGVVTFNGAPRLIFTNGVPRFPTAADPNPIVSGIDLAAIDAPNNMFLTLTTGGPDSIGLRFYQINFYGQDEWRPRSGLSLSFGLRYEYNTPPREVHGLIENTFSDPLLNSVPGLSAFIQGRTSITDPDRNNLAPRVGLVYSPRLFGPNRVSVFRAGYGIFYDQLLGAVVSQSRNVFPSFFTLNFGGGPFASIVNDFPLVLFNPVTASIGNQQIPIVLPGTINRLNPQLPLPAFLASVQTTFPDAISPTLPARTMKMPSAQHYNVAFEQQLKSGLVVALAYVGTQGRHLLRFTTPNLGPALNLIPTSMAVIGQPFPTPFFRGRLITPARPVDGVGGLTMFETTAKSRYESLQIQLRGRLRRAGQFQVAYTLSKASDDVSDVFDLAGAFALPQNSLTRVGEYGPANFDVRHRLTYNFMFDLTALGRHWAHLRWLTKDLQLSSTGSYSSGQPFTVNSTIDVNLDGNLTDRLNNTNGLVVTGNRQQPLLLTASNTLSLLAPFGQDGQIGRNTFRAGSVLDLDLSLLKSFALSSKQKLSLRADFFNFINRANFAIPVRELEAPGFGKATSTVTPGLRVQFSIKYGF